MERNRIIYDGLCCKVNVKAAFVDRCLHTPEISSKMLTRAVAETMRRDKLLPAEDTGRGVVAVRMELDEERREQIYEDVFGKGLREGAGEQLTEVNQRLLEPIEMMHLKEMRVDVIPFLMYAIVRNERCRSMLERIAEDCADSCIDAFRRSEYNAAAYLRKFLLTERRAAKLAAGLILLLRAGGDGGNEERYRGIMDIIYAGYRPLKNVIKKLDCLEGEQYRDSLGKGLAMELELSRMVVQMVIAEDLSVPIAEDYEFCQVVCMLKRYEDDRLRSPGQETDMAEGKRIYRELLRKHWNPGAYYVSAFLENINEENNALWRRLESLLGQFGLETAALYGLCLEKWEAEVMCAVFEEKDWERYKYLLLVTTLCKYIQQIEAMYENDVPEEVRYRRECEENTLKSAEYEKRRLEQKICGLERQGKDRECKLAEAQRQIERLKREALKREEKHEKDKAELRELQSCILRRKEERTEEEKRAEEEFRTGRDRSGIWVKTEKDKEEDKEEDKEVRIGKLDKSIVIGGHRNWQRKMRRCLPNSQFLESDHMHFDPAVLHNKKYIIVNTDILKHGLYYKIMSERKKGQKILYVHGNNIDRTLRELADQL